MKENHQLMYVSMILSMRYLKFMPSLSTLFLKAIVFKKQKEQKHSSIKPSFTWFSLASMLFSLNIVWHYHFHVKISFNNGIKNYLICFSVYLFKCQASI